MLDKLDWVHPRLEELGALLSDPAVVSDQEKWRALMKEHSQLEPLDQAVRQYAQLLDEREGAKEMLSDPDMADMAKEELARLDEVEAWIKETFAGKVEAFRAGPRIVDVHTKGVSKIKAARDLQKKLGKKILVCVGDAENDIPMLEGADFAFCPADGVVADRFETVCNCGDGAIADVIYKKIPEILGFSLDNSQ